MMTMTKFFAAAGKLLGHVVREEGEFPRTAYISCFTYERGYAEYLGNGREGKWVFKLSEVAA